MSDTSFIHWLLPPLSDYTKPLVRAASPASSAASSDDDDYSLDGSEPSSSRRSSTQSDAPGRPKLERVTTTQLRDYRQPSTFHLKERKDRTLAERICSLGTMSMEYHLVADPDEVLVRGPPPTKNLLEDHWFIITRCSLAPAIQQASYTLFPSLTWHPAFTYVLYWFCFQVYFVQIVNRLDAFARELGTFKDTVIGRDRTPDSQAVALAKAIFAYVLFRPGLGIMLHYKRDQAPLSGFTWTYPFRAFAFMMCLDLLFYSYHRASHEVDALWFIHSKHHSTRHPSPVLSILSDFWQECLEIALIPLLTAMAVPMSFPELWLTLCYLGYQEILGHSGIRAVWGLPVTGPVLRIFGWDLNVEDHDLHHQGGRGGMNYGKATRFWDCMFGTCAPRQETAGLGAREF